ncbi:MAG: MotA/TolQ/ExbB proton channel family protein [Pirellulales bacterium]
MSNCRVQRVAALCLLKCVVVVALVYLGAAASAADEPPPAGGPTVGEKQLADEQFDAAMAKGPLAPPDEPPDQTDQGINLLHMASPQVGGIFMYPIYFFSFIVVLFAIERAIALRRRRVIPRRLVSGFRELLEGQGGFDPRKAYRLCGQYPSAAASVLRAGLLKIGRPHAELESAVTKASEREATRLYANIRPLNLSATVAPLLGLIGTVQGMIIAFYRTAYLPDGANKAQALAEGVYIALVTTFAGLCVAIPAVCLAHFFEGKIQRLFSQLEELVAQVLPVLERYEGKMRVSRGPATGHGDGGEHVAQADAAKKTAAVSESQTGAIRYG